MDFSVLMSVYGKDEAEYFRVALESVSILQTQKPTQIVIVQDGPVPEQIDLIIETLKKRTPEITYTVIKKEKNAGLAAALNTGLAACAYDLVARMDSDDISAPDRFEKQITYFKQHPHVSVMGGAIAEFASKIGDMDSVRQVGLTHEEIREMAMSRSPMNHVSVMFRKAAVDNVGGYSENFGKLEDYKLWVDLMSSGAIFANLEYVLVYVRIGNGFLQRRSNRQEIKDWDMLQTYLLKSHLITKRKAWTNRIYIRAFIYMPAWMKKAAYKLFLRRG